MRRVEEIVRDYREAETPGRMDIYLGHPALRGLFDEIEREGERGSRPEEVAEGTGRGRRWCPLIATRWRQGL